jgi:hypothetical protein
MFMYYQQLNEYTSIIFMQLKNNFYSYIYYSYLFDFVEKIFILHNSTYFEDREYILFFIF